MGTGDEYELNNVRNKDFLQLQKIGQFAFANACLLSATKDDIAKVKNYYLQLVFLKQFYTLNGSLINIECAY